MKRSLAILWMGLFVLLAAAPGLAKSYRAESHTSSVQMLPNGDLRVTEEMRFRFNGGPFTRTFRTLPRRRTDGIWVESGTDSMEVQSGSAVRVMWRFPACADTVRVFQLVYRVAGGLGGDGRRRTFDWTAFPTDRRYTIHDAIARVEWPADWPEPQSVRAGRRGVQVERAPHAAVFRAGRLKREEALRMRITFPAQGIMAPLPAWQVQRTAERDRFAYAGALGAAILVLGIVLVLVLYRELSPHRQALGKQTRPTAPPSELSPVLAGVLASGDAKFHHLIAALADLAARGQLGFEGALSKRWWGGGEYVIRRTKHQSGLEPWEQSLFDSLARYEQGGTVSWSRALTGFRGALLTFRARTRAELERRGDFDPHAGERARSLGRVAAMIAVLALGAFAVSVVQWQRWGPGTLLPGFALIVVASVALAAAASLPRYTPAGWQRAQAWRGFAAHLAATAKRPQGLANERFQAWLPLALALGVGPAWIQAGRKSKLAVPEWFRVPGADSMSGFAALFIGASAVPTGAGSSSAAAGGAGGGASGAH